MSDFDELERREKILLELIGLLVLHRRAISAQKRGDPLESVLRPLEMELLAASPIDYIRSRCLEAKQLFAKDGIDFDAVFEAGVADLELRYPGVFDRSPIPTWQQ